MLFESIQLVEGAESMNLVVDQGSNFPSPIAGELFYITGSEVITEGLYFNQDGSGTGWKQVYSAISPINDVLPSITTPGTYTQVTVDDTGRVTDAANPNTLAGLGITDGQILNQKLNEISAITTPGVLHFDGAHVVADASAYLTANETITLSGDATGSGTTSIAVTLVDTPVSGGTGLATYVGTSHNVPTISIDRAGRITEAINTPIEIYPNQIVPEVGTGNVYLPDYLISQNAVQQYQSSVAITEAQVVPGTILARLAANDTITGNWTFTQPVAGVTPTLPAHLTTKQYVDNVAAGVATQGAVAAATTANITLSGLQAIDGYTTVAGDRILVKNQIASQDNGIYVASTGAWTRATDFDGAPVTETATGDLYYVEFGTANGNSSWILITTGTITVGTTPLTFSVFSRPGDFIAGAGLTLTGHTFDVVGSAGRIIANADNIDLANVGSAGSYSMITTDQYGRVISGSANQSWSLISGVPTTIAGYGLSGVVQPYNDALTGISTLAGNQNGILVKTGVNNAAVRSIFAAGAGLSVTNSDGIAGNITITSNATQANGANTIVFRDASGNFLAGTITAALAGNASTASKLQTPITLSTTGDATGSVSFDGSSSVFIPVNLGSTGVTAGSYTNAFITVDAKGRITTASSGPVSGVSSIVAGNNISINNGGVGAVTVSVSGTVASATYLANGVAGSIPYQTAVSTTGFTAAGTAGQILMSNGTGAPTWTSVLPSGISGSGLTAGSVQNVSLANSKITIGSTLINLGDTVLSLLGLNGIETINSSAGYLKTGNIRGYDGNTLSVTQMGTIAFATQENASAVSAQGGFSVTTASNTSNNIVGGGPITLTAGNNSGAGNGDGGAITLQSGSAGGSGNGGSISLSAGRTQGALSQAGSINITAGGNGGAGGVAKSGDINFLVGVNPTNVLKIDRYGAFNLAGTAGTAGQVLQTRGAGQTPQWYSIPTSIQGGAAMQIPFQSAANTTAFSGDLTYDDANKVLQVGTSATAGYATMIGGQNNSIWQAPGSTSSLLIRSSAGNAIRLYTDPGTGGVRGGDIRLYGGNSDTGTASNILLSPGVTTSPATNSGVIKMLGPVGNFCWTGLVFNGPITLDTTSSGYGQYIDTTITGNTTVSIMTPASMSGFWAELTIRIHPNPSNYTVTWPASVTWATGSAPVISATNTTYIKLVTVDAGATYQGYTVGNALGVTSVATGTGLTGGPITGTGTISLANTGVAAGAYTNANITIDAQGRITTAANGVAGGVTSLVAGTNISLTSSTGTVTVNVSGKVASASAADSATTAVTATYLNSAQSSTDVGSITTRVNSGFYQNSAPTTATGWPVTGSWWHLMSSTHSNTANYYAMQLAADFYTNNLYYRSTNGNGSAAWSQVVLNNGGSYAINITGTAALAASGVAAGSYTSSNITVDAYGRVTSASSGSLTAAAVFAAINGQSNSDWYRTSGATGWYNSTYATGIYSTGAGLVQTYNGASFQVNGTLYATGDVAAFYSDMRLKDKTGNITGALTKVNALSGFYYKTNALGKSLGFTDDRIQIGVSAQEVEAVVPEAVCAAPFDISRDEGTAGQSISGEDYKTVKYERLVPLLIEAIKELSAANATLVARINVLEATTVRK